MDRSSGVWARGGAGRGGTLQLLNPRFYFSGLLVVWQSSRRFPVSHFPARCLLSLFRCLP